MKYEMMDNDIVLWVTTNMFVKFHSTFCNELQQIWWQIASYSEGITRKCMKHSKCYWEDSKMFDL